MNLLLLEPGSVAADGLSTLDAVRAKHVRQVLGARVGSTLRAGVLDESRGLARVELLDRERVVVRYEAHEVPVPLAPRVLLLAMPRPKAFSRCLQHAAALGFSRILVLRCQRVEKGHLSSARLDPARLREDLVLGLEQGGHVRLPEVRVFARFKPFVQDTLDELVPEPGRFVAHVGAPSLAELGVRPRGSRFSLALGPDGGFVPYEVELLQSRGFIAFGSSVGALRVESALSYFTGQLDATLSADAESVEPAGSYFSQIS